MKEDIRNTLDGMAASDKLIYVSGKLLSTINLLTNKSKEFNKNLNGMTLDCSDGKSCLGWLERVDVNIKEMKFLVERIENLADLSRSYSFELETSQKIVGEQIRLMDRVDPETGEIK